MFHTAVSDLVESGHSSVIIKLDLKPYSSSSSYSSREWPLLGVSNVITAPVISNPSPLVYDPPLTPFKVVSECLHRILKLIFSMLSPIT